MRKSPHQVVTEKFGDKKKLVGELAGLVEKQNGDSSDDAVKSRLLRLSNQKLLRLYTIEQKVREQFGDKDKLVDHIMKARTEAGLTSDDALRNRLVASSKGELLDMTNRSYAPRPAKQTPEQRLKSKHGKKERERALAKAK